MKSFTYFEKLICSILATLIAGVLLFLILYAIPAQNGDYFTVSIVWIFAGYGLLFLGLLLLLLRLLRVLKTAVGFGYVWCGVANVLLATLCVLMYVFGKVEVWWMHQCLWNAVFGLLVIGDGILSTYNRK